MMDFLGQLSNKTSCFDDFWMVATCTLDRVGSKLFMFQASLQDDAWVFNGVYSYILGPEKGLHKEAILSD